MSTLVLLVVLLLALVLPLYLGALGYVVLRHPRFAQPLTVCGTWAPTLVALVALAVALG
ncbi:hypothetical protein ACFQ9J_35620 [Streptomyces sp. NPDC056529]|uniref:hypothetical protein n=1 Tax=Streptomyces sp. NPDC056529 TaxID=3345855 RepID=UPI0036CB2482